MQYPVLKQNGEFNIVSLLPLRVLFHEMLYRYLRKQPTKKHCTLKAIDNFNGYFIVFFLGYLCVIFSKVGPFLLVLQIGYFGTFFGQKRPFVFPLMRL